MDKIQNYLDNAQADELDPENRKEWPEAEVGPEPRVVCITHAYITLHQAEALRSWLKDNGIPAEIVTY